ncbi:molecular chaperone TorD family protein [Neobacillus sp. OS1-2]|uniref:TorD/DmsD family molecular chaperone n=1 Tax=Neobacillus sp. OS1-2 TaxID=3070680 RepID=UPI0027E1497C|nr:molecular chaperone TorD family protein [Neobacillus sp. OS1-2]WML40192.1 molecular chaperone TorD family protein [Neobacillus sp. OS1-2]
MTSMSEPLHKQLQPFFLARQKFYQLLYLLFQQPTNKLLEEIRDKAIFQGLAEDHEGGKILCHFFDGLSVEQINNENEEYQRLFVGPGPLAAPPWESYYRSKEQLLFEEWMYEIREQYHQFGLRYVKENNEPDDHLLLELEFMMFLANLSLQETNPKKILELISSQIFFLEKHLTVWIPFFCAKVIENTTSRLYLGTAMVLVDFVCFDKTFLLEVEGAIIHV